MKSRFHHAFVMMNGLSLFSFIAIHEASVPNWLFHKYFFAIAKRVNYIRRTWEMDRKVRLPSPKNGRLTRLSPLGANENNKNKSFFLNSFFNCENEKNGTLNLERGKETTPFHFVSELCGRTGRWKCHLLRSRMCRFIFSSLRRQSVFIIIWRRPSVDTFLVLFYNNITRSGDFHFISSDCVRIRIVKNEW